MKRRRLTRLFGIAMMLTFTAALVAGCGETSFTEEASPAPSPDIDETPSPEQTLPETGTPFEKYGRLQIVDGQLSDELGRPVQLKGMSTFGLQWGDGYWVLTDEAFDVLANDWQCDIIRLAVYITEDGYENHPAAIMERVERGIELATERGMYVIIDWHVLTPGDPTYQRYLEAGLDADDMPADFIALRDANPNWTGPQVFFGYLAQKYGHQGNVLYETANEPNGLGSHAQRFEVWSEILKPYHESIIYVIRQFDSYGIVICGTDNWGQFVDAPIHDPIDDPNVMYTVHFYAGTHDAGDGDAESFWLREMIDTALEHGLAVFATEWGVSSATGDGGPYIYFAERWMLYLQENGISWTAWSMAQKSEISAAFFYHTSSYPSDAWSEDEVSIAGNFYRAWIRGDMTPLYTYDEDGNLVPAPPDADGTQVGGHNGDIRHLPVVIDEPGVFIKLPFDFESETREGWSVDGATRITNADLSIDMAESAALMFPGVFVPGSNEWADGVRLSTTHSLDRLGNEFWSDINAFTMDIYLEPDSATTGLLMLTVVPVPGGGSFWHEAGTQSIDPVNGGELITTPDGRQLLKFSITQPFSISDYAEDLLPRNLVLVLFNDDSDYAGTVWYDNIGFVVE